MSAWLRQEAQRLVLSVHVQPGAKKTEVVGEHGQALKIRLVAPPVDGRANDCLLEFLAVRLGVGKRQLQLVSGSTARAKRVSIEGVDAEAVRRCLLPVSG